MKKLTLKEAFLAEKDTGGPVDKVNRELGGFKSLLHGDGPSDAPKGKDDHVNKVNDELKGVKWESFEVEPEDAFSDAFEQQGNKPQDIEQLDEPFHEAHCEQSGPCECGGIMPVDSLERVSITVHPADEEQVLHSDAGTFGAPGGPGFDQPEIHHHEPINDAVDPVNPMGVEDAPSVVDDGGLANLEAYLQDIEDEMSGRADTYASDFKANPNKSSSYNKEAVEPKKEEKKDQIAENVNRLKRKLSESLKKKV